MESAITEHLQDEEIVQLLDSEATEEEAAAWNAHLLRCESCRLSADEIGAASGWLRMNAPLLDAGLPDDLSRFRALEKVRSQLASTAAVSGGTSGASGHARGVGTYPGRARSPYRLVAAGISVLVLASLTVNPVRAWIFEGLGSLVGGSETAVVERADVPARAPSAASARFTVRGPLFRIEVAEPQVEGVLTVRLISGGEASARIVGESGETLVVLPSGLRVGNREDSSASYTVELPADIVREVEVRVGDVLIGSSSLDGVSEEIILPLAPQNPRP